MGHTRCAALMLGLMLLGHAAARAQTSYNVQPIIKLGDQAGSVQLQAQDGYFDLGTLNDNGQIMFTATDSSDSEALIQYSGGTFTPIVSRGAAFPGGAWPQNIRIMPSVKMNRMGSAVFAAGVFDSTGPNYSAFLWDGQAKQVAPLTAQGKPATQVSPLVGGESAIPVINNKNEMVLVMKVSQFPTLQQYGVFFRGADGTVQKVVAPGDTLPDGRVVLTAGYPELNDAGVVAFLVRGVGDNPNAWSAYTWSNGTITPIARVGQPASNSGQLAGVLIGSVFSVWLNNNNNSVLIEANINRPSSLIGLFRYSGGQLREVAVPNQQMPDGGILRFELGPSYANELGQHAFLGELADGSTAAYLIDTSGALTTILKSGTTTNLGKITSVGPGSGGASFGIGLNSHGQVAVTISIDGGVDTLALLTPATQSVQ